MPLLDSLPDNSGRRLLKVVVRTFHLVGVAGVFGNAMANTSDNVYAALVISSGIVLVIMESYPRLLWFVQLRGIATVVKLLILLLMHRQPALAIPCLVAVIAISGFMAHAPSWIRYFSVQHGKVIHSSDDILG